MIETNAKLIPLEKEIIWNNELCDLKKNIEKVKLEITGMYTYKFLLKCIYISKYNINDNDAVNYSNISRKIFAYFFNPLHKILTDINININK